MNFEEDVAQALLQGWGLRGALEKDTLGVSNLVWSVRFNGEMFWIRRSPINELEWRQKEANVLARLSAMKTANISMFSVPELVRTQNQLEFHIEGTSLWTLTRDLPGVMPDPNNEKQYAELALGLARVHNRMMELPQDAAVAPKGILEAIREQIDIGDSRTLPTEIRAALDLLNVAWRDLEYEESFVIHGDYSHPNIKIDEETLAMKSLLDFEHCSVGPAVMDFSSLALTLLTRSDIQDKAALIDEMKYRYETAARGKTNWSLLPIAMLGRKLDSYWHHQQNLEAGSGNEEVVQRQVTQLRIVLQAMAERLF